MIKSILSNSYVALACRLLLGLTFVFAGVGKIAEPAAFAGAIANYKLVPVPLSMIVATVLPWTELICGFGVLTGVYLRGSSLLLFALLSCFTVAVLTGIIRGLDISCGCFTLDPEVHTIGWQKVLENLGFILVSIVIFYSKSDKFRIRTSSL